MDPNMATSLVVAWTLSVAVGAVLGHQKGALGLYVVLAAVLGPLGLLVALSATGDSIADRAAESDERFY